MLLPEGFETSETRSPPATIRANPMAVPSIFR